MSSNEKNANKIFIPSCKECNGYLNFIINPFNFSVEYKCEKNDSHNKRHIYFNFYIFI